MKRLSLLFLAAVLLGSGMSCSEIEEGFLSDGIRYKDNVISCKRGVTLSMSDRIDVDGSTPPYEFRMLNLREKTTGEPAPAEFFTEYEILVFKEGMVFNAETDTTLDLLNQKRELVKRTPMIFNGVSGQLIFNKASVNLPLGEYAFDIEMTNVHGTKLFEDLAQVNVMDPTIEDMFEVTYQAATGSDSSETFTAINAPRLSCTKISNEGARVILKITDKNGIPWNPAEGEVIKRGDRPMFETHARFNPVIETDTALICDFEVAPFPLTAYIDQNGTDWSYLIYYRIPKAYAQIDGLPNNNVNPVFGFRLFMEGTYVVEVRLTDVVRIAPRDT